MVCRKIKHIGNTVRDLAIQLLTPIILFIVYREILGGAISVYLVLALMVYGSIIALSAYGGKKIVYLDSYGRLSSKLLFLLSLCYSMPIYLFWALFSAIPGLSFGTWFAFGLPLAVLSITHFRTVSSYFRKHKKLFWIMQIGIYIFCFGIGRIICSNIIK